MKTPTRFIALAAVLGWLVAASTATAQDNWVNKKFMPRAGTQYQAGAQAVREEQIDLPLKVEKVQGEWLDIGPAWVLKRHVVPLESAEAYYTDLLRRNRQDDWAWGMRGVVRDNTGNLQGAVSDLSEAMRLNPKDPDYYFWRANARYRLGDQESSIRDLEAAASLEPNNASIHYRVARAQLKSDVSLTRAQAEKAIEHLTEAIRLDPTLKPAYGERGFAYLERIGDFRRAAADLDQAIEFYPEYVPYYKARGFARNQLQEYAGAIADLAYVVEHTRERPDADAHRLLSWILATCPHAELRDGTRAVELATKANELTEGRFWLALHALACAYAEAGDFEAAAKWQNQAIEAAPAEPIDLKEELQEVLRWFQEGKPFRQSVDAAQASKPEPEPSEFEMHFKRAAELVQEGKLDEALVEYAAALKLEPKQVAALTGRARVREQLQDFAGAVEDYDAVLDNSADPSALIARGRCKLALKDFSGAIEDCSTALKPFLFPIPEALVVRGIAYVETKQYEAALKDLRRAKSLRADLAPQVDPWIAKAEQAQ
jgi:tetratricopeptide (TPR) repeat protein